MKPFVVITLIDPNAHPPQNTGEQKKKRGIQRKTPRLFNESPCIPPFFRESQIKSDLEKLGFSNVKVTVPHNIDMFTAEIIFEDSGQKDQFISLIKKNNLTYDLKGTISKKKRSKRTLFFHSSNPPEIEPKIIEVSTVIVEGRRCPTSLVDSIIELGTFTVTATYGPIAAEPITAATRSLNHAAEPFYPRR